MKVKIFFLFLVSVISWISWLPMGNAYSIGDAAVTVALTTGTGAVLGLSTLPFYETPGDHKSNIFYGAAIGAVSGVALAAYAALQEEADETAQSKSREQDLQEQRKLTAAKFRPVPNGGLGFGWKEESKEKLLLWTPLATVKF